MCCFCPRSMIIRRPRRSKKVQTNQTITITVDRTRVKPNKEREKEIRTLASYPVTIIMTGICVSTILRVINFAASQGHLKITTRTRSSNERKRRKEKTTTLRRKLGLINLMIMRIVKATRKFGNAIIFWTQLKNSS